MQIYFKKRLIGELSGAKLRIVLSAIRSSPKARYRIAGEDLHCQNKTALEIISIYIDEIK